MSAPQGSDGLQRRGIAPASAAWEQRTPPRSDAALQETLKSPRVLQREAEAVRQAEQMPHLRTGRPLRIAFLGTHGIPANYSGFETFVDQLATRLAARGHDVTVYCRKHHFTLKEKVYKGVKLVVLPTITTKQLDTIAHTFLSLLHGEFRSYDIVYICGVGSGPLAFIPRLVGVPSIVNVDGADWQRDKWGRFAKWYLRTSERLTTRTANVIIADSHVIEEYYRKQFNRESLFIPYGSDVPMVPPGETLRKFGLAAQHYILWVGRLVPENNCHDVITAYQRAGGPATGLQLCILGDAPYQTDYIRDLKAQAGPGVVFTGFVYGEGYHELGANAYLFVFASGVGGTHPALLEGMARGNCIIVNDMNANMETVADTAIPYHGEGHADALTPVLIQTLARPDLIQEYRRRTAHRAATVYNWEVITDQYEDLFYRTARKKAR